MTEITAPETSYDVAPGRIRGKRSPVRLVYRLTVGLLFGALRRFEHYFDDSDVSRSTGARRMRRGLAVLFSVYGIVLESTSIRHGDVAMVPVLFLMLAVALFIGRGGSFVFYFVPLFLGLFSYVLAGQVVANLALPVHYTPQLKVEEWLTPGPIPTVWLQDHLYKGRTGVLEWFTVAMYLSHFLIPLLLGFYLAVTRRGRAFAGLMFGLLAVSILGAITFVLAPTAPPWLAAREGYVTGVHHILKQSLFDVHLTKLANLIGDSANYDTTAAVPSLHTAFPIICLLCVVHYRLGRPLAIALALNVAGVVFAIVYSGEHYLIDAVVGAMYAAAAWILVQRLLRHVKGVDTGRAEIPSRHEEPHLHVGLGGSS